MSFNGKKIFQLRWEKRLSGEQVASLMGNTVSGNTIRNWEQGKSAPTADNLGKLAAALGVEVGYFFE